MTRRMFEKGHLVTFQGGLMVLTAVYCDQHVSDAGVSENALGGVLSVVVAPRRR